VFSIAATPLHLKPMNPIVVIYYTINHSFDGQIFNPKNKKIPSVKNPDGKYEPIEIESATDP